MPCFILFKEYIIKYRIITNGEVFYIQIKTLFGWKTVKYLDVDSVLIREYNNNEGHAREYNNEGHAEESAQKFWGTTRQRVRKWKVC